MQPEVTGPAPAKAEAARAKLTKAQRAELDTKLIAAAWANDVKAARSLIKRGADVNAKDDTKQSAYLIAASEGYDDLLQLTLLNGAQVNAKDRFNGTALIRAAERGHATTVGTLVQAGIDLDHINNLNWTALHEAVVLGNGSRKYVDTVRTLVAAGADVAIKGGKEDKSARTEARQRGYTAIAGLLESASKVQPTQAEPGSPIQVKLQKAAAAGEPDAAALALRAGAQVDGRNAQGQTPLLIAAANDQVGVARLLLGLGADPDALDARHDTPWLVTGVTGSVPMAELLLTASPDLTITNRFGGLSIIPASERGHVEYVRRVVKTKTDVNHVNYLGWTALLEAAILGDGSAKYQQIVQVLLAAGADPTISDRQGKTALQHAKQRGHKAVAAILREAEAAAPKKAAAKKAAAKEAAAPSAKSSPTPAGTPDSQAAGG